MKGLVIVLDGLGDRPVVALGGRTPLEAAHTPHLDALVQRGQGGLLHPLAPWVPVSTQVGMGMLMGLVAEDVPLLNRGPVEAAGAGLALAQGDVALRCNFATVQANGHGFEILDRRAGRIRTQREPLAAALNAVQLDDDVQVRFATTTGHRGVLVLSGTGLSSRVSDTDPGAGRLPHVLHACTPLDDDAKRTARLVNDFVQKSYEVLDAHPVNHARRERGVPPANAVLTRGAGKAARLRNQIAHLGLRVALVTGERTAVGLGRLFGFDVVQRPAFTADAATDLGAKARAVETALHAHDLVYLHIKAPDLFSHDGDPEGKRDFLERADAALAPLLGGPHVIVVTGDHSSDSLLRRHTGDPVPVCLAAPHGRRDEVEAFSETACIRGGLGQLTGADLVYALLDHMDRLPNYRSQDYLL